MKLPVEKVRKIMKIAKEPISLETPIGEEEDSHLGDSIEDKKVASPARDRRDSEEPAPAGPQGSEHADRAGRESAPLEVRHRRATDHTLEEVGQEFDVTREAYPADRSKSSQETAPPQQKQAAQELHGIAEGRFIDISPAFPDISQALWQDAACCDAPAKHMDRSEIRVFRRAHSSVGRATGS